ncbi:MAG TPA: YqaA family protein [Candidatus Limnocylindria bacterium]|nr:YqaA family protein [Candidatus Limnocylindria bacterium]
MDSTDDRPGKPAQGVATAQAWQPPPRPGMHRRLYDWVTSWADSPHGTAGLAGLSFAESSFFPIPPDVLLIALGVSRPSRAFWYAFVCTAASALGGLLGYLIGWGFWHAVDDWFFTYVPGFSHEAFERVQGFYNEWGIVAVMIAGFTPIPYKVFTIASGLFGMNVPAFFFASVLSRGARFFIEASLIARFGPRMREVLERNFNLMTTLFVVLLVAGFLVLRWLH